MPVMASQITSDWMMALANVGVAGIMLVWFATRVEARMKAIENSTNRTARAILVLVISMKSSNEAIRVEATAILKEIDRAERNSAVTEP